MLDLTGQRFGKLVALRRVPGGAWMCQCDCGGISYPITGNLLKGNSRSCGSGVHESNRTHGQSKSPEYGIWKSMHSRCRRETDGNYRNYGGRGIKVCERWKGFVNFLKDMGPRPTPLHELDRINNDKGYSLSNCRWTTHQLNLNNRRGNRLITFDGRTQTITQWAVEVGMNERTLNNRINRGWSVERALTVPVHP